MVSSTPTTPSAWIAEPRVEFGMGGAGRSSPRIGASPPKVGPAKLARVRPQLETNSHTQSGTACFIFGTALVCQSPCGPRGGAPGECRQVKSGWGLAGLTGPRGLTQPSRRDAHARLHAARAAAPRRRDARVADRCRRASPLDELSRRAAALRGRVGVGPTVGLGGGLA